LDTESYEDWVPNTQFLDDLIQNMDTSPYKLGSQSPGEVSVKYKRGTSFTTVDGSVDGESPLPKRVRKI